MSYSNIHDKPLSSGDEGVLFVTMGTISTGLAVDCITSEPCFARASICVVPALGVDYDMEAYRKAFASAKHISKSFMGCEGTLTVTTLVTIEDDVGRALNLMVSSLLVAFKMSDLVLKSHSVTDVGPSFRSLSDCLEHFKFTVENIRSIYQS